MSQFKTIFHANPVKAAIIKSLTAGASFYRTPSDDLGALDIFMATDTMESSDALVETALALQEDNQAPVLMGSNGSQFTLGDLINDDHYQYLFDSGIFNLQEMQEDGCFLPTGIAREVDIMAMNALHEVYEKGVHPAESRYIDALRLMFGQTSPDIAEKHLSQLEGADRAKVLTSLINYIAASKADLRERFLQEEEPFITRFVAACTIEYVIENAGSLDNAGSPDPSLIPLSGFRTDASRENIQNIMAKSDRELLVSPSELLSLLKRANVELDIGYHKKSAAFERLKRLELNRKDSFFYKSDFNDWAADNECLLDVYNQNNIHWINETDSPKATFAMDSENIRSIEIPMAKAIYNDINVADYCLNEAIPSFTLIDQGGSGDFQVFTEIPEPDCKDFVVRLDGNTRAYQVTADQISIGIACKDTSLFDVAIKGIGTTNPFNKDDFCEDLVEALATSSETFKVTPVASNEPDERLLANPDQAQFPDPS